jgi:secreted trypsin-like serine protease
MRRAAFFLASISFAVGCNYPAPAPEAKGSSDSLIVGGTTADVKSFEGMIQTENDQTGPWCGATLIAADWAVTAAHCVIADLPGSGFQRVVLGRQRSDGTDGETINVTQVIRHEAYNDQENRNDIALLKLATKSTHTPVRLATKAEWPKLATAGTNVTVIGWGATSEGGEQSTTLLQVTVPIVSQTTCNQQYQGIIDERQVCAGLPAGGKDSCQGDSGGPLFEKVDGQNVQVGIVSFGNGCARANFSGVYTAVASFRDWIQTNTNGAVPATTSTTADAGAPTTTDAGVPTTDAGPTTTPNSAGDEGSAEDTGSAPTKTTDDGSSKTTSGDDDDVSDDHPKKKKKPSSPATAANDAPAAQRVATCAMGRSSARDTGGGALTGLALLVFAARRRSARGRAGSGSRAS